MTTKKTKITQKAQLDKWAKYMNKTISLKGDTESTLST